MATNATYKVYNGSQWIEYHFTTNAGQVTTTYDSSTGTGRKFLTPSVTINGNTAGTDGAKVTVGSGDTANIEIWGSKITSKASAVSGSSLQYIAASDSIAAALGKLDKAAKDAYDHVPTGCVTSGNGGAFSTLFPDLNAIEGLSGTSGFLKKTAANTWALDTGIIASVAGLANNQTGLVKLTNGTASIDTTSYVPSTRKVNGKALSSDVSITAADIVFDANASLHVDDAIDLALSNAAGMALSFAIAHNDANATADKYANSQFSSTSDSLTISATSDLRHTLKLVDGTEKTLAELKIGDTVFVSNTDVPDRWLGSKTTSGGTTTYVFYKLETYNMTWGAITGKPSSYTPSSHTHGNITNDGKITATAVTSASGIVVVDSSGVIKKMTDAASMRTLIGAGTSNLTLASSGGSNGTATTAARSDHTHSYIPLSGTSALTGSITPNTDDSIDLGSTAKRYSSISAKNVYGNVLRARNATDESNVTITHDEENGIKFYQYDGDETYHTIYMNNTSSSTKHVAFQEDVMKVTVASTAPSSPKTGDVWIQA